MPQIVNICTVANWEDVVNVIEGTPLEQHLDAGDMRALVDKLAQTRLPQWRAAFEDALVAKLTAADPDRAQPATVADLKLLTSVFSRRGSGGPLWYPELLRWSPSSESIINRPDGSYYAVRKCPPWSAHEVHIEGWRRRLAARLVTMAGLDPATATYEDINRRSVWFGRADEVAMVHRGERAHLHCFFLTMWCAWEKAGDYVDEGKEVRKHAKLCENWEKQQAEKVEMIRRRGGKKSSRYCGRQEWRTEGDAPIALAEQTRAKRLEKARRSILKTRYRTVEQVYTRSREGQRFAWRAVG
ncbi:hypothetical protein GGG16DRAFT_119950 [Schizophyllum commune]